MADTPTRAEMIEALRERVAHLEYHRGRGPLGQRLHELECMRAALRELEAGGWRPISEATEQFVLGWVPLLSRPTACSAALAAIEASGYSIHRFHDWQPDPAWQHGPPAPRICPRCGAREDGLLSGISCTPELAATLAARPRDAGG